MYSSAAPLSEDVRRTITAELTARVIDSLDLYTQVKVAHWNLRGPHFASLHPLFDTFATEILAFTDALAERAVTLGGVVHATAREVAKASQIKEYPSADKVERDLDHAKQLAERFSLFVRGLHGTRAKADALDDTDTVDLLTGVITAFEKHAWFLNATAG